MIFGACVAMATVENGDFNYVITKTDYDAIIAVIKNKSDSPTIVRLENLVSHGFTTVKEDYFSFSRCCNKNMGIITRNSNFGFPIGYLSGIQNLGSRQRIKIFLHECIFFNGILEAEEVFVFGIRINLNKLWEIRFEMEYSIIMLDIDTYQYLKKADTNCDRKRKSDWVDNELEKKF